MHAPAAETASPALFGAGFNVTILRKPARFRQRFRKLPLWARRRFAQLTHPGMHCTIFVMMTDAPYTKERRSSRVFTRLPVRATGKNTDGRKFRENSQTIVINAHGGLLYLQETLELGSEVLLDQSRHRRRAGVPRGLHRRHFRQGHAHRRRVPFAQPALLGRRICAARLGRRCSVAPGELACRPSLRIARFESEVRRCHHDVIAPNTPWHPSSMLDPPREPAKPDRRNLELTTPTHQSTYNRPVYQPW